MLFRSIYEEDGTRASKRRQDYFARVIERDATELAVYSPTRRAQHIKIPVLLVHGDEDKATPREHALKMRDALVKQGNPPEWMMVPREGHGFCAKAHGFCAKANTIAFYKKLENFLAKHLAAKD